MARKKALDRDTIEIWVADEARIGQKNKITRRWAYPISIDEADSLSLVILGPPTPHSGKGTAKSAATDAAADTLMRCRASQRRYRNTLLFAAPDEALLATA